MSIVRSPVRSVVRSPVRGVFGAASLIDDATSYLANIAPYHWFDFVNDRCLYASNDVGGVSGATGYSFSRASTGYYENADGTLTSFASGALRRGNRGVLIEGARTNLLLRSQEFDNASWTKDGGTISANALAAPDLTTTADLFTEDTSTGIHRARQTVTLTAAAHTISFFVKPNGRDWIFLYVDGGLATAYVNVATGATGTTFGSPTIRTTALTNGWRFVSLSWTNVTTTSQNVQIYASTGDGVTSYTGDGTSGIYLWGAQLEAASFPSSYIPTTTASATRAADVLTCTAGVSYPLSLWAEFERVVDTGATETLVQIDNNSNTNGARLGLTSSDTAFSEVTATVSQGAPIVAGAVALGVVTKLAGRASTNSLNTARNGTLATEDTVATMPTTPATLRFGQLFGGTQEPFGYIRRAAIVQGAVSDANLQAMTQ